jgi:hypothetical protein
MLTTGLEIRNLNISTFRMPIANCQLLIGKSSLTYWEKMLDEYLTISITQFF